MSHVELPLKFCRAAGGCSSYTCGCRATLCRLIVGAVDAPVAAHITEEILENKAFQLCFFDRPVGRSLHPAHWATNLLNICGHDALFYVLCNKILLKNRSLSIFQFGSFVDSGLWRIAEYHSNRNVYQTNSQEFEVGKSKNYQCPKKSFWFLSRSFRREAWHRSADIKGPLLVNLPELPIRNSEEFEVGNGKNYLHPKKSPVFFSRSVKILVRMVTTLSHGICPCKQYEDGRTRWRLTYHCDSS